MRLTTSVIAGFIAFGAATPAGLAVKPSSIEDPVDAVPAQHTPVVDGNWHIGCDKNNYCSYYQGGDLAVGNTNSVSPRTIALSEASCKQCSTEDPCDTTISTSVVTVTAMPTSEASISDITTTITLARTAVAPTHTGLAPRDELASNDGDNQSPTRRTAFKQSECFPCNDQTCPGCDFACDEDQGCEHFLCKDPLSEAELCISYLDDAEASKAYDTSMASGDFLGSAAMLLVLAGDDAPTSNTTTTHLQPAISNGTRPDFSFADEDCYLCESGDESCNMCDWQFTCGIKKKCFHNGAREVVELCFEKGEKCRP
ncbi:hypothetical protein J4E90_000788 [Alternaria incomplexa]|uniref:uncharacterized protein n=1 Tax=Alternaria incomplexa TaxID=1187928 RepID=UPI00221FE110|nr:uncharacterized protein J4E90_000788 [Alternaria incomplexa]KAI4922359.1 hypothetical protein J4E90_000788 [Alternaria incomplexa]